MKPILFILPLVTSLIMGCTTVSHETQNVQKNLSKAIRTIEGLNPDKASYVTTEYKDLDEDGVPDAQDQCPNTAKGYAVNRYGCELDSDGDGIFDRFDQCPRTPRGVAVNFLGCEGDEDQDKVLDSQDECPGTPLGTPVNDLGCKVDNDLDRDGVLNKFDRCPGTPLGSVVNAYGCKPEAVVTTNIVFNSGSYKIREDQRLILVHDLSRLRQLMPNEMVLIIGFTDSSGSATRNLALSWNRAQSTKNFFVKGFHIPSEKVYILGYGEAQPVATNATKSGRQKNRRIELKIVNRKTLPKLAKENIPKM